jgi:membrane protease YdiL (CAAX protease family)
MTSPDDPSGPHNLPNNPPAPRGDPRIPFESAPEARPAADPPGTGSSSTDPEPLDAAILSCNPVPRCDAGAAYPGIVPPGPPFPGRHPSRFLDPDLRVPWGWLDLLLLVFVYLGATAISTILLAIVFASQGVQWTTIQHSPRALGFFVVADQILIYIALFLYLWIQARVRFDTPFWRTLGWRRLETTRWPRPIAYLGLIAFGFALSASVQLLSAAFPPKAKLPIENFLQNHQAALALMAMSVVLAPVVEETIFRGYLYPVAARSFGIPGGIVATGTVFGLLHAEQLWGGWAQIALLVGVGIILTWVRAAQRTVLASYLLHVSYNFLIVAVGLHSQHP